MRSQKAAEVRGIIDEELVNTTVHSVTVDCTCPKSHYWKLSEYSYIDNKLYQLFKCAKVNLTNKNKKNILKFVL